MKSSVRKLAIAVLTFSVGVALTRVVQQHPGSRTSSVTHTNVQSAPSIFSPATATTASNQSLTENEIDLEAGYVNGNRLTYAGYEIERSVDAHNVSSASIRKNGRTLAVMSNGGMGKESTAFGLFPFLGPSTRQLVVMQYSGGAHCCWIYKIYDFYPGLHLIFDSEKYNVGYELGPKDIDSDGKYELIQAIMTFDYFHLPHSSSVFPTAVFSYDYNSRSYLPANRKFKDYVLRGIEDDRKDAETARLMSNATLDESDLSAVLQVSLKYIYAGRRSEGFRFFDQEYQARDKDEIERDLRKALRNDLIYRSLYAH